MDLSLPFFLDAHASLKVGQSPTQLVCTNGVLLQCIQLNLHLESFIAPPQPSPAKKDSDADLAKT